MIAVLLEIDVRGVERDAFLTELREQTVPAIKSQAGFESGTWLMGNGYERAVSLTLWDTKAHAQVMIDRLGLRPDGVAMSASVVRLEVREVAETT